MGDPDVCSRLAHYILCYHEHVRLARYILCYHEQNHPRQVLLSFSFDITPFLMLEHDVG